MYYLRRLLFILCCLPLPLLADSDIRIHGGVTIDTGNLRLFISDRHLSSHLYVDRNNRYEEQLSNRPDRYRSQRYYRNNNRPSDNSHSYNQHKQYRKHYAHSRYDAPKHNRHYNRSHHRRPIIIRDPGYHDYRKFRHQRSYSHW